MRKDEVLHVTGILNALLNGTDQTETPERTDAARRYAALLGELNDEIRRRQQLVQAGERAAAEHYEADEITLAEALPLLRLTDERRYAELCQLYGWPVPPRPALEQAAALTAPESEKALSLKDLLNRWHGEAARLPVGEKLTLLRRIRRLDPEHADHWEQLMPELERQRCQELFALADACSNEAGLEPLVKEMLTSEWVSPVPAAARDRMVGKLKRVQAASRERRKQSLLHDLADGSSRRDPELLAQTLAALDVLLSDPDCLLNADESRQKLEAETLASELRRQAEAVRRAAMLTETISSALDEGTPFGEIEESYRALQSCGTAIDPVLARRVHAAADAARETERKKIQTRQLFRLAALIVILAAGALAYHWYQREARLRETLTAAAAFLKEDRPHQAAQQLEPFLLQHPGMASRGSVVMLRQEVAAALQRAAERTAEFDRNVTVWEASGERALTAAEAASFRQQEAGLRQLPTADDAERLRRLETLTTRVAAAERAALRQRERENLAWCETIQKELLQRDLPEEKSAAIERQLAAAKRLSPPLTPLEEGAFRRCQKQFDAWRSMRQEKAAAAALLRRLAAPASATAYLHDLAALRSMPPVPEDTPYRQNALPWLDPYERVCRFRFREPAFTGDREADELIRQIRTLFPDRTVRQILPRLYPEGKLAGEPMLKRFTAQLDQWVKELPQGRTLYEVILLGPQGARCRFFSYEPPEIERAGRGRNRPLAVRLKVLASADGSAVETIIFRWQKNGAGKTLLERTKTSSQRPEFRHLPLSFTVDGAAVLEVPRQAAHWRFARETTALFSRNPDRDQIRELLEKRLLILAADTAMEPLCRLQLADKLWQLLTTVEPLYAPAASEFRRRMKETVPAGWNVFAPAMTLTEPSAAAAMTALLTEEACRKTLEAAALQRERERLALRRFPRPAGVMTAAPGGKGVRFSAFPGESAEAELWRLEKDSRGTLSFRIVKASGRNRPFSGAIPAGTLLFTPADDQPTPPLGKLPYPPQCWPLPEESR